MKLVILDRDGVINQESPEFIKSPDEWIPIDGSLEAIGRLSQAGYEVVIVTNQSGVGRGLISADMLAQIHVRMRDYIQQHGGKIQIILYCPHHPDDNCDCRKPKPGLYTELTERLNVNLSNCYSVGDSMRDLVAAKAAGALPALVKTGNGRKTLKEAKLNQQAEDKNGLTLDNLIVFDNLAKFVDALLNDKIQ
ncbi:MAG: D-glycero-beta-D-manno-heptose 1,7-bisphosphate 7-phosphatase [Acidiferrobacterales bacterium]|nr:D-glycero-beta-D-manno-heptose 1,7-bisphosphate 7-phosphatase [Acidiferrobacterales bacterium]